MRRTAKAIAESTAHRMIPPTLERPPFRACPSHIAATQASGMIDFLTVFMDFPFSFFAGSRTGAVSGLRTGGLLSCGG